MKTGFYSLSMLSLKELKSFFKEAIMLSYNTHIDVLDCRTSWRRQECTSKTIKDMLKEVSTSNHNTCINRSIQHENSYYGEIGYCTMGSKIEYFLYIFVSLENLEKLIMKYKLTEQ